MPLEILHRPLVLLGHGAAGEGAEIAPSPGLRVYFARIEPVFAGGELADHGGIPGLHTKAKLGAPALFRRGADYQRENVRDTMSLNE
jgi:hypothetical protein